MAQQRIKYIRRGDGTYATTVEADVNTLTAQPVALDAGEEFRLIVDEALEVDYVAERVQQLITDLRLARDVEVAARG